MSSSSEETKVIPICRFFNRPNGCRLGDSCTFRHEYAKMVASPCQSCGTVTTREEYHPRCLDCQGKVIYVPKTWKARPFVARVAVEKHKCEACEVMIPIHFARCISCVDVEGHPCAIPECPRRARLEYELCSECYKADKYTRDVERQKYRQYVASLAFVACRNVCGEQTQYIEYEDGTSDGFPYCLSCYNKKHSA